MIEFTTPCREWRGTRYTNGYGRKYIRGSKPYRAALLHRWVWEQFNGPIPDGMCVLHRCDNPPCFRLDHLFLGTHSDNMRDMHAKRRRKVWHKATSCKHGHPYPQNAHLDKRGWQHCRECDRLAHRRKRGLALREV